ncbi:hypothetical protein [Nocardioides sp. SYSU DS0651]|uniref:hypothetical protein n=1 Tax=Nocardioides sp. SYSU DS0651 TaxID=3415955 RepID=UPI003F4C2B28
MSCPNLRATLLAPPAVAAVLLLGACGSGGSDGADGNSQDKTSGVPSTAATAPGAEAAPGPPVFTTLDCEALDPLADEIARAADEELFVGPDPYTFESKQSCGWSGNDGISFEVADATNGVDFYWDSREAYEADVLDNALPDERADVEARLAALTDLEAAGYSWGFVDASDDLHMVLRWAPEPGQDSGAACEAQVDDLGADVEATVAAFTAFCTAALEQAISS